jgi:hypothetical protein
MMNEHGKSDRPVVPVKSPNQAGQPAAEGREGRGLAQGNLPQPNAFRTPSRTDALSALERVRQAARKERRRAAVLRPCWRTSTFITCSTCGFRRGVGSERMAT